ncbi:MAG: acyl-protein synthetase [Calditrichaceae bacterium]|nr:acyl-protein synthetase [Calditrichia bacterium]NUQ42086.1 acyl-protein synthetase [Calditrichaceae bacterium]
MNIDQQIDQLISEPQYQFTDAEKEKRLLPVIREQLKSHYRNNRHVKSWLDKLALDIDRIPSLAAVPPLPTQMFKYFDLQTSPGELQRILYSSSTSGQTPSRIPISPLTAQRQTKALAAIIKNHFGAKRRPFLAIDSPASNREARGITARGAAIRGFSILAREMVYAFDDHDGRMVFNEERVRDFFRRHQAEEVFALGFTFVIWSEFRKALLDANLRFHCPNLVLVHGGGWKKLRAQSVSKEVFSGTLAGLLGSRPENVLDYYGMVEQTGIVFIDCVAGHKHAPNFAEVKIRNYLTLEENGIGQPGYIEIMNLLPDSYPGMSILTEDVGEILGADDCPCGRKGKYFVFRSRLEKSEARGCGDTFREN